jgi:hypothetical protein
MSSMAAATHAAIRPGEVGSEARTISITGTKTARWVRPPISRRRRHLRWVRPPISRRRRPLMRIETVATRRRTQHAAVTGIGIVPDDAPVRRHPFQVIMRIALGPVGGTLCVVKIPGMGTADSGQKSVQRLHSIAGVTIEGRRWPIVRRRPIGLCRNAPHRGRRQQGEKPQPKCGKSTRAHGFLYVLGHEPRMNMPSRQGSVSDP